MDATEYQKLSVRTRNNDFPREQIILNMLLGIGGEAGEIFELCKKALFHKHPLDISKLSKELGDLTYYISQLADLFDLDLSQIMEENLEKLRKRYPEGFSVSASINRLE